jgi:hypothetical protein
VLLLLLRHVSSEAGWVARRHVRAEARRAIASSALWRCDMVLSWILLLLMHRGQRLVLSKLWLLLNLWNLLWRCFSIATSHLLLEQLLLLLLHHDLALVEKTGWCTLLLSPGFWQARRHLLLLLFSEQILA